MVKSEIKISVIIPILNNAESLKKVIPGLNEQVYLPSEIVIIDSTKGEEIEDAIQEIVSKVPIFYTKVGKAFPYEATNLGAEKAKHEWLAFLDATTTPETTWLSDYVSFIKRENIDIVFGVTKYVAQTRFQAIIRACTYGGIGHETAPGTLMRKEDFFRTGRIIEGVRSGGDIEWRNRLKILGYSWFTPSKVYLTYTALPTSLGEAVKKFFIYQLHGAKLDVQNTVKSVYLALLLVLSAIIIPKWNSLVGWESSPLYMPNITKIYLSTLVIFFIGLLIINKLLLKKITSPFFSNMLKTAILISLFYVFFRWNEVIAGWVEDSVWYIPNITKIYVLSILLASIIYRGLYFPLKNKIEKEFLFPFRWIQVGLVGLLLDLAKTPGYIIGSLMIPYKKGKGKGK